jgi:large subunit ribosomal protein L13
MEYVIDAKDKALGRVASEAAMALRGKKDPSFAPHKLADVWVTITNSQDIKVSGNKREEKVYTSYTGYPGGLRKKTMEELIERKGIEEVIKKSVYGMLPGNRLRPRMMKRLTIK